MASADDNLTKISKLIPTEKVLKDLITISPSKRYLMSNCLKSIEHIYDKSLKEIEENLFQVESVLDSTRESLNIGHWSNVPLEERYLYSFASIIKAFFILRKWAFDDKDANKNLALLRSILRTVDMGLLLGAPLPGKYADSLTNLASFIASKIYGCKTTTELVCNYLCTSEKVTSIPVNNSLSIQTLKCPSLETFRDEHFNVRKPVILTDCISHWPAIQKWNDLSYILSLIGERTVPVEIGSQYTDESWSQKLITGEEFITSYILSKSESSPVGYLAQYQLFNQIPELLNDIRQPEYCCLSDDYEKYADTDINAWFGPKGTVSSMHFDPKHNLLVQVVGVKQVILFSPSDSKYLYPFPDILLNNTAQVDPRNPDLEKFPLFSKATPIYCTIKAGDMLYIPPKWWHHVSSLSNSFSVSFWWE